MDRIVFAHLDNHIAFEYEIIRFMYRISSIEHKYHPLSTSIEGRHKSHHLLMHLILHSQ